MSANQRIKVVQDDKPVSLDTAEKVHLLLKEDSIKFQNVAEVTELAKGGQSAVFKIIHFGKSEIVYKCPLFTGNETTEQLNLLGKTKKEEKAQELLITSRLMEIVADKVALLFCNNLEAAVKGILYNSVLFDQELSNIEANNLYSVLEKTNEEGAFTYQEISIRIKSLYAFYLSDTYDILLKKLQKP